MRRVFVYEFLSGGGAMADEAEAAALLPLGVSMRDAIVADLLDLPDVQATCAVCARRGAAAPRGASATATAWPGEDAAAFVQRMARTHDLAWIVAPESDGWLARLHEAVGDERWIGCRAGAIQVASSKSATLAVLAAQGVCTPMAFTHRRGGRWIVKPDDGAGAIDTRVHDEQDAALADLEQRRQAGRSATLEPFVEGVSLSVSMLVGPGSAQAVAFNRQDIAVATDGTLSYLGVRHNAMDLAHDLCAPQLHALAAAVVRAMPGLRGFVGFDLVWNPERGPVVIEVNPRVTCAYVGLSALLRRNLAALVLALHDMPEALHAAA
jgi:predicted ATP-grasp superfamily ATP-dependent carboligase